MEDSQKVRQMTQKEVSQVDASQVAYYTLTDGTIVKIKREGENVEAGQSQNEPQYIVQNQGVEEQVLAQNENLSPEKYQVNPNAMELNQMNQQEQNTLSNQYQDQVQIESQQQQYLNQEQNMNNYQMNTNVEYQNQNPQQQFVNERENVYNYQINTNSNPGIPMQTQNNQMMQSILQPGDNYVYYNSNERNNIIRPQPQICTCTCAHQMPPMQQGLLNGNANLINAQETVNQMNQLGLKLCTPFGLPMYQQGQTRRQLYKLVTAVPVKLSDITGVRLMDQKTNSQIHFHTYNANTYMVGNTKHQNDLRRMGMNVQNQNQLNLNNYNQYMQNSTFNQQKRINQSLERNQYGIKTNPVQKVVSRRIEQTSQYSYKKGNDNNVQQFQENEYRPDENQENLDYRNCELQYSEQSKGQEQNLQNIRSEDLCNCDCDCGSDGIGLVGNNNIREEYEAYNPKSRTQKEVKRNYNYYSREGYTK